LNVKTKIITIDWIILGNKPQKIIVMKKFLLEKIEELTLYIIDLQKQIDELKK